MKYFVAMPGLFAAQDEDIAGGMLPAGIVWHPVSKCVFDALLDKPVTTDTITLGVPVDGQKFYVLRPESGSPTAVLALAHGPLSIYGDNFRWCVKESVQRAWFNPVTQTVLLSAAALPGCVEISAAQYKYLSTIPALEGAWAIANPKLGDTYIGRFGDGSHNAGLVSDLDTYTVDWLRWVQTKPIEDPDFWLDHAQLKVRRSAVLLPGCEKISRTYAEYLERKPELPGTWKLKRVEAGEAYLGMHSGHVLVANRELAGAVLWVQVDDSCAGSISLLDTLLAVIADAEATRRSVK